MKREVAWRVFAGEYNDATVEIKGEGEMTPSYVITPLGAKINRLFIIGVLTDVENISESGDLLRAHVSDPTGVFTLYSGQYQQDATDALSSIEVPAFVAVIGKSRTYRPDDGEEVYVSIRPERIIEVNADTRNQWIMETCKNTKDRIEAIAEAKKMNQSNATELIKLGYSRDLSEGVISAIKNYQNIDVNKYLTITQESLKYLTPDKDTLPDAQKNIRIDEKKKGEKVKKVENNTDDKKDDFEEIENSVLKIIKDIEGKDGALWDSITSKCEKDGIEKDSIEEALTSLMDKGMIYEPILGTIKTT